jgi:hypothetical protein
MWTSARRIISAIIYFSCDKKRLVISIQLFHICAGNHMQSELVFCTWNALLYVPKWIPWCCDFCAALLGKFLIGICFGKPFRIVAADILASVGTVPQGVHVGSHTLFIVGITWIMYSIWTSLQIAWTWQWQCYSHLPGLIQYYSV